MMKYACLLGCERGIRQQLNSDPMVVLQQVVADERSKHVLPRRQPLLPVAVSFVSSGQE